MPMANDKVGGARWRHLGAKLTDGSRRHFLVAINSKMSIRLANESLWSEFHANTTEMVVTKGGRKMFPKLEYSLEGLDPSTSYGLVLEIEQVGDTRYKYSSGEWSGCGRGEPFTARKGVQHSDGVMSGAQWMRANISFDRLKITNNPMDHNSSHLFLQSMHKYVPVLRVFQVSSSSPLLPNTCAMTEVARLRLDVTEFIAVTAYQNQRITQLKIEHNPFAKGFRDGGERKRGSPSSVEDVPPTKRATTETLPLTTVSPMRVPFAVNPAWFNPYFQPYFNFLAQPYPFTANTFNSVFTPPRQ